MGLKEERCIPCRGNVEPLSRTESESLAGKLPGWTLDEAATRIAKRFRFADFAGAIAFAGEVGRIAEAEGHHPDLSIGWGYCAVTFTTHKIKGLHRNDFVMAARVEALSAEPGWGKVSFRYETYIADAPDAVWGALLDAGATEKYWQHENVSDWRPGSRWEHRDSGDNRTLDMVGRVVECVPPRRLVLTWALPEDEAREEKHSRVILEVEPYAGVTRLSVTHDLLEPGSEMLEGIADGWPKVLSSLKTLLETGVALPVLWQRNAA
ncbi:MAG TPA: 4a-hydroxytetrahydrobiopterin dehydratase [Candidatus Deferrimicrobiaceae bacterium]